MIEFCTTLFDEGKGYNTINSAKSAILNIIKNVEQINRPQLKKFMKGTFNLRPSLPKYSSTWDVNLVFTFLKKWHPPSKLDLKQLMQKTAVLLLLLSGRRGNSIVKIGIKDIIFEDDSVKIKISELTKTSSTNFHVRDLLFLKFSDSSLCLVTYLRALIDRTKIFRSSDQLLISFKKPYKPISRDTLSRWLKGIMALSGVDLDLFKAHSARSASASKAINNQVSLSTIMKAVGWRKAETIAKFYQKPIEEQHRFAEALLEDHQL